MTDILDKNTPQSHLAADIPTRGTTVVVGVADVVTDDMVYKFDMTDLSSYWFGVCGSCWEPTENRFDVPVPALTDGRAPHQIRRIVLMEGNAPTHMLDGVEFLCSVKGDDRHVKATAQKDGAKNYWIYAVQGKKASM